MSSTDMSILSESTVSTLIRRRVFLDREAVLAVIASEPGWSTLGDLLQRPLMAMTDSALGGLSDAGGNAAYWRGGH
jgi:hypothetical protein